MEEQAARVLAAALALIPLFGVALALGNIFSTLLSSIARNPSVSGELKGAGILYFALTEAIALFALLIAFLILYV
jgi:F0F1-type ATP synthase membrane subunit c/vacuolar-type H+-ATPase subunit K